MMKRLLTAILAAALALSFAACGKEDMPPKETQTDVPGEAEEAEEVLTAEEYMAMADDLFYSGTGWDDDSKAIEYYLKAAELGSQDAAFMAALLYNEGYGTETDYDRAVGIMKDLADGGYSDAMVFMGNACELGRAGLSAEDAFGWYEKAAELGNVSGMYYLAQCYGSGNGVEADGEEKVKWLSAAADAGDGVSMMELALTYFYGDGVAEDNEKAVEYFERAYGCEGYIKDEAAFYLGVMYELGFGVKKDTEKAMEYYWEAAEAGDATAYAYLGHMYLTGSGTEKDLEKAFDCLTAASEGGDSGAMVELGGMYEKGTGTEKDVAKAGELYKKAAEIGSEEGLANYERLQKKGLI